MTIDSRPRRLLTVLFPALLVPLQLLLFGITLWTQGNLMVGDYGVLNGQDIDWSDHSWRNRYELALWIAVPVALVWFARKGSRRPPYLRRHDARLEVDPVTIS